MRSNLFVASFSMLILTLAPGSIIRWADEAGNPPPAEQNPAPPFWEGPPGRGDDVGFPKGPRPGVFPIEVLPVRPPIDGWHLGVYGRYTSTGHLLTEIVAGSPAAAAGLEPGDRIISVNGQQVGEVLGTRYPIDALLQRHASPGGWVRLLVLDRRTRKLLNLDVQLSPGRLPR